MIDLRQVAVVGVLVVLGGAVLYQGVRVRGLEARLVDLEAAATLAPAAPGAGEGRSGMRRGPRAGRTDTPGPAVPGSELGGPAARDPLARPGARANRQEILRGRIEAFAGSHELDVEQTGRLQELALETLAERMALRRSVAAGEIDREEALDQLEERRKAFEEEVLELVGPEGLDELREALRPARRGPGGRRMGM